MGAGGGYSTELIARAVAPGGVVYGQNPVDLPVKLKAIFEVRLKTPAMKDVVADIRPFDDPVPPDYMISTSLHFSSFIMIRLI
jgi:predicted methyltransferase